MLLLEVLNAKYADDIKNDQAKQVTFIYSRFSPIEACLLKSKVNLRDILSLVQTNLLKLMIDLKEKELIYKFFQKYNKALLIDARDLE